MMDTSALLNWFRSHGGKLAEGVMDIIPFDGQGYGGVALRDIAEGETIFAIPRSLTLSTRTSSLPLRLGVENYKKYGLHQGWSGLILSMMWEESLSDLSQWSGYLVSLPNKFDTPMFWNSEELEQLRGTAVVDKIGRSEVEEDYYKKVVPALQQHPDLFPPEKLDTHFTLERYHIMGSRILSRSFHVEKWEGEEAEENDTEHTGDKSIDSAMDVDEDAVAEQEAANAENGGEDDSDDENDEDDTEDPSDVAMVPMADILNARYGCENAKLFYEPQTLNMVATKNIAAGEQIWNTYGDPPNSDLLRRYGHVDLVPLANHNALGNPADIVEVRADLVLQCMSLSDEKRQSVVERIDWWLEQGGDDVFIIDYETLVPPGLVSIARLFMLPPPAWEKTRQKGKPPKSNVDPEIAELLYQVLTKRREEYVGGTAQDDETRLSELESTTDNSQLRLNFALIVRLGEKRLLEAASAELKSVVKSVTTDKTGKRKASSKASDAGTSGGGKRARR